VAAALVLDSDVLIDHLRDAELRVTEPQRWLDDELAKES
jgi:hypothetical protein